MLHKNQDEEGVLNETKYSRVDKVNFKAVLHQI